MRIIPVSLLLVCAHTGCAARHRTVDLEGVPAALEGQAEVEILRTTAMAAFVAPPVSVNGEMVGFVGPARHVVTQVPPGRAHIQAIGENTDELEFPVEADHRYAVLLSPSVGLLSARVHLEPMAPEERGELDTELKAAAPPGGTVLRKEYRWVLAFAGGYPEGATLEGGVFVLPALSLHTNTPLHLAGPASTETWRTEVAWHAGGGKPHRRWTPSLRIALLRMSDTEEEIERKSDFDLPSGEPDWFVAPMLGATRVVPLGPWGASYFSVQQGVAPRGLLGDDPNRMNSFQTVVPVFDVVLGLAI